MIVNADFPRQSNIEIAMERARTEGARRDAEAAAAAQANVLHFSTDDIPGIDDIAAQYSGANTANFTHRGQIGVRENGEPIVGETRVYIITEEPVESTHHTSQEKDMNTNQIQSEVQAAAQAAAESGQRATASTEETLFNEQGALLDEGVNTGEKMVDELKVSQAGESASEPSSESTLKQEPKQPEQRPEKQKFSFKTFFKNVGNQASSLKDKVIKPKAPIELDQEVVFEVVKGLLAAAVKHVEDGVAKLPKGNCTQPSIADV